MLTKLWIDTGSEFWRYCYLNW